MSEENKSPLDGAIWHHMDAATIAGFGPWVRHADHVAEIERLRAKLAEKWSFCPECGSDGILHAEGPHKQCGHCYQEWFSDMDYTGVIRKHLARNYRDSRELVARAEAARDAAIATMDTAIASDEAAEKRLASAKEVIAPFAERYAEISQTGPREWRLEITDLHLRAAAEWMEKGDE